MRELRKDSAFVTAAKEAAAGATAVERRAERLAGWTMMQEQEADAKRGGQGGQWKRKKK